MNKPGPDEFLERKKNSGNRKRRVAYYKAPRWQKSTVKNGTVTVPYLFASNIPADSKYPTRADLDIKYTITRRELFSL